MRGATGVILQLHQILRLPRKSRKMTLMIDPRHIWNVIYNARSNRSHPPTSPNTASANIRTIRPWSEDNPNIIRPWNRHLAPAASETLLVPSWRRILYGKKALRLSPKISRNAAPAIKSDTPTSPNTAPATQNRSHDWSASHMKRPVQCAEQVKSPSILCSSILYSSILYSSILYSSILCSSIICSSNLYSSILFSTILCSSNSLLLYSLLLYSLLLYSLLYYSLLLHSLLLYSLLLYSLLLYYLLLYSLLFYSLLLYSLIIFSLLLYSLLFFLYSSILYSSILYSTILCSSILCSLFSRIFKTA